jgi:hypothetical protein
MPALTQGTIWSDAPARPYERENVTAGAMLERRALGL